MKKFLITIIFCFLSTFAFTSCNFMNYLFFGTSGETNNNTEQTGTIDIPPLEYDILARPDINVNYDFITFEEIKDSKGYIFYTKNNPNYIDHEPSELEMEIIKEVNLFRDNPGEYFDNYIASKESLYPDNSYFESCKSDLHASKSLGTLSFKKGLFRCAYDHANTLGKTNGRGHDRTCGKTLDELIQNYGTFSNAAENISYGQSGARNILIQLLIDDNVDGVGHRKNLLKEDLDGIGAAYYEDNTFGEICVIDFGYLWHDIESIPKINVNNYVFYSPNNPKYIDEEPSKLEMEIINEINLVRKNPKAYFDNYMAENSRFFNPDKFDICKNALYNQNPLPELKYKKGLFRVANDQVNTQIYTTKQGYNFNRINKTSFENIIKNYGTFKSVNESFTYTYSTPRRIVMELLVDTNCPSTPYDRQNILSSKYDCIGVATSPHIIVKNPISNSEPVIEYDYMTVLDFAENWKDK